MKHELRTIADIIKVINPENIDNFLIDFKGFLTLNIVVKAAQDLLGNDADVYLKEEGVMQWIDDGKTDATIKLEVKDGRR